MGMILVTGQPGHGKTAWAIDHAFQLKKEGREVYASGIKDFDYQRAGFHFLAEPEKWQDLPDGSVVLLDECYTVFPNRNPGAKVPDHVEAMARHRHRGFDFVLIAQQGLQLDPFLRGLYEQHIHVRQTSVLRSKTKLKRWNQYQGNVNGPCNDVIDWLRPKYVFDYYTSTTKITTKRHVPTWLRWLAVGVVFLIVLLLALKWYFTGKIAEQSAQHTATHGSLLSPGARAQAVADPAAPKWESAADYAKAHLPRFATMPWTAPVFDQRNVVADPQLFCMSSKPGKDANGDHSEGSCTCLTEQATTYDISEPECRRLAARGQVYNPYRVVAQGQGMAPFPTPAPLPRAIVQASPSVRSSSIEQVASYGTMRDGTPQKPIALSATY